MKYTYQQLETISEKLRRMPKVEKSRREHSKQEAVKILSREIVALQKRGYTLDQIAELLRGEGLSIATPTLKNYLQRAKPAKRTRTASLEKKQENISTRTSIPEPDSDEI